MPEPLAVVFPTVTVFVVACVVFFVAEFIYSAFGFGAGLIAVGTLALVMPDIKDVVVLLLLVNIPVELAVVWPARKSIRWHGLLILLAGIGAGILAGTAILVYGTPLVLLTILGLFLFLSGLGFAAAPGAVVKRFPGWTTPLVGLSSGVLAGLFGTGGPPLIFYYQLQGVPKSVFRGSLMALFLLMTGVRLPAYAVSGLITSPRLVAVCALLPVVLLGAYAGHRAHIRMREITFRRAVGVALALIGVLLILRHVL
jgi:uncharacterized membrane protein YfcA